MKSLTPSDLAPPFARYAHGVEVPAGHRIVRTSGQLGLDPAGTVPATALEQARICFGNIDRILTAAGMTPADIMHVSAFVTGREHMAGYMQARDEVMVDRDAANLPSSTLMIVSGFTRPEFVVEVEVWAAAP